MVVTLLGHKKPKSLGLLGFAVFVLISSIALGVFPSRLTLILITLLALLLLEFYLVYRLQSLEEKC